MTSTKTRNQIIRSCRWTIFICLIMGFVALILVGVHGIVCDLMEEPRQTIMTLICIVVPVTVGVIASMDIKNE